VAAGGHDTSFWRKAGAAGMLGVTVPEEYGGPGGDKLFNVIQSDEVGRSLWRPRCSWTMVPGSRSCAGAPESCPVRRFRHSQ
jgi:alkylation response protein AidB-like acyl-CoA dehydrogenase